ncbi:hypothetical protein [Acinetobacter sp. NIPH 2699]|uniref:hypothetical protein n=1 Tax=Acinetobacter sp. NIPH 2699 TaxID=2923433 RepID=UPI001F4BAA53|nr:hypothetical protein [Acinetobacter sp. NIPH 2699]MCH7335197.1 hypothetical protein [Acinetobacter sp. NIPH 2699]
MSNTESGLQYDELGFLIGLKQTGRDVSKIDKNVEAIHAVLLSLKQDLERSLLANYSHPKPKLSALEQALINAQIKPVDVSDLIKDQANPIVKSTLALDRAAKTIEDLIDEASTHNPESKPKAKISRRAIEIDSPESVVREFSKNRERDANGRFIGEGGAESKTSLNNAAQVISTAIQSTVNATPQSIDPTVDAISEVATALSPVKRAASFMLRPLTGFMKSRKRNEPIPKEQADHNKKQIKALDKIADNKSGGGSLLGLLRFLPIVLSAIAGIGGVIAAGFTAAAPIIAATVGAAVAGWFAGKALMKGGKKALDLGKEAKKTVIDTMKLAWKDTINGDVVRKDDAQSTPFGAVSNKSLSSFIGQSEGDYNSVNLGEKYGYKASKKDLTLMTVAQVKAMQESRKINAAGKFQIIRDTMPDVIKGMGLTGKEKFDEEMQERMGAWLAFNKRPELGNYIRGKHNDLNRAGKPSWK